jgi:hypothetical protein
MSRLWDKGAPLIMRNILFGSWSCFLSKENKVTVVAL